MVEIILRSTRSSIILYQPKKTFGIQQNMSNVSALPRIEIYV